MKALLHCNGDLTGKLYRLSLVAVPFRVKCYFCDLNTDAQLVYNLLCGASVELIFPPVRNFAYFCIYK